MIERVVAQTFVCATTLNTPKATPFEALEMSHFIDIHLMWDILIVVDLEKPVLRS